MSNDDFGAAFGSKKIVIEPTAEMRQNATALFQMKQAWIDAGFTETQAMQLVLAIIAKG
jgi:hypothetical protein